MESIIDIQLVKEQLRLLGHDVADSVILEFVKGLGVNKSSGGTAAASNADQAVVNPANIDAAVRDTRAPAMPINSHVDTLSSSKEAGRQTASKQPSDRAAAWACTSETDAAPSKMQQAPDQQSPKRLPVSGPAGHEQDSPPAHSILQRAALDQRCRNFLSRCSDKPSPQQQQEQQQQQQQHDQLPQRPILLQVPHLQDKAAACAHSSSSQLSSAASSELSLGDAGADTDSSEGSMHNLGLQQSGSRRLLGQANSSDSDSDSEGSSVGLEAEGSKFLLHQAATMQRVRARLAAKMAGYTAAAANAAHTTSAATASDAQKAGVSAGAAAGSAAAGAAAASTGTASSSGTTSSSADSAADAQPAAADSSELPRFGFRPGYKPVGIHMPPPPSAAAVEALAAARTLRQQAAAGEAGSAPAGVKNSSQKGVSVPPLKLDVHMQPPSSAVKRLHDHQQASQQLPMSAGMGSSSNGLHLLASPGKVACPSVVAGARVSGSIIAGDTPPCMSAAGHKTRQSPRVDPLYLAPSSPRRSNPATPRSSPALSPVPLAPLSAAAVGLGLMSSPAGTAPAAAMGATRSASSSGSRQCLSFSAGGRAVAGRSSAHQQQQREGAGSTRRVASAPPTPSAVAPSGAHRAPGPGAGSNSGNGSYSARRSSVSHESLYCQRLAYSSQRSTVAPGVRKTDRVARFQQMQQQWSRDRFLSSGAGGASAEKTAGQQ